MRFVIFVSSLFIACLLPQLSIAAMPISANVGAIVAVQVTQPVNNEAEGDKKKKKKKKGAAGDEEPDCDE